MRLSRFRILPAWLCVSGLLRAAAFEDRVEALFRPPVAEMMALSPDGQRVAYTTQEGRNLAIVIISLSNPGAKRTVIVEPDRDAVAADRAPVQLRFLRWATPNRLVFAPTERVIPLPPVLDQNGHAAPNPDGPTIVSPIVAVDADGKQQGTLVDARDFMETPDDARKTLADLLRTPKQLAATRNESVRWRMPRLDILGFFPGDREQLIIQTSGGYSRPAQHLVDIRTGNVREFGGDWPQLPRDPQVFDWFRLKVVGERQDGVRPTVVWRDDDLGRVQRELDSKFPRRVVEILDWSDTRARVLCRVTGGSDPGRLFVFQRPENLALEILRCAPWLTAANLNDTRFFEFAAPDGARLSGYLTWPKTPRVSAPPLLVFFPSGVPGRAQAAFDAEAQTFADLGYVVARLNHRTLGGFRPEDITALKGAVDRVSVEDAVWVVEGIAGRMPERPFDRKRVAAMGRGFGGYLAVRALQLQPGVFRCGIAVDAPMDLRAWLRPPGATGSLGAEKGRSDIPAALIGDDEANWRKLSVLDQAEALTNPVFLLLEPNRPEVVGAADQLRARLQGLGRTPEHLELDPGFAAARPTSRAMVYRKVEEFLNLRLNDYAVKIGPTKEVE